MMERLARMPRTTRAIRLAVTWEGGVGALMEAGMVRVGLPRSMMRGDMMGRRKVRGAGITEGPALGYWVYKWT